MGGPGSTRWNAHYTRRTVDTCLSVSIVDLYRNHWRRESLWADGCQSGVIQWSRAGQVLGSINWRLDIFGERRMLTLSYKQYSIPQHCVVPVQSTAALRGVRWWLMCPTCNRRCAVLYLPPRMTDFACRKCHNLTYASSQSAHTYDNLMRAIGLPPSAAAPLFKLAR